MPKNPLYADKVILNNGGTIERVDGTAIVSVNAAGTTTSLTGTETIIASEIALADGKILVGGATNIAAAQTMGGDATINNAGVVALSDTGVTDALLTNFVAGAGVVTNADTVLQAFNKIDGNVTALSAAGVGGTLTSGRIIVGNGGNVAAEAVMSGDATMDNVGAVTIANDAVTAAKTVDNTGAGGLFVAKKAFAVYDFAIDGGAQGAIVLNNAAILPDNAVVTAFTYDVIDTFTSGGADAATVALSLPVDGALTTAIAISDGSNPWDQGVHLASVITPIAVKTTAARQIGITVAGGQDLTAGKAVFCVDYYVSQ